LANLKELRGEAIATALFRKSRFHAYIPTKDIGIDLVVTPKRFGTGRQVEVQVKYAETVYCTNNSGHFAFEVTPRSVESYPASNSIFFFLIGRPVRFELGTARTRNRMRREMSEGTYLVPLDEVRRWLKGKPTNDQLGVNLKDEVLVGNDPNHVADAKAFRFKKALPIIRDLLER